MNARGSTEVIVATIGLSMGALSQTLFTMILAMAVVTTMAMPPMLRWSLARVPLRPDEEARLEREAFEAEGFVPNIERLLVAVDDSPSGRFASRLVGLLAGIPPHPDDDRCEAAVRAAPIAPATARRRRSPRRPPSAAETDRAEGDARAGAGRHHDAAAGRRAPKRRSRGKRGKGYDLLFIGVEPVAAEEATSTTRSRASPASSTGRSRSRWRAARTGGPASAAPSTSWCRSPEPRTRGMAPRSRWRWRVPITAR